MGLKFNCSNAVCRQRIEVHDALAGGEVFCPACGAAQHVPASHDIRFACNDPACQQHIVVDVSEAGRYLKCPACGIPQRVPGDPPRSLAPEAPPLPASAAPKTRAAPSPIAPPERPFWREHPFVACCLGAMLAGLLLAGLAKVSSPIARAGYPPGEDAMFGLPRVQVLVAWGLLEWLVAAACLRFSSVRACRLLLAWYAGNWLVYRMGEMWLGQLQPLPALGAWGGMAGLPEGAADHLMTGFVLNLLMGLGVIRLVAVPRQQSDAGQGLEGYLLWAIVVLWVGGLAALACSFGSSNLLRAPELWLGLPFRWALAGLGVMAIGLGLASGYRMPSWLSIPVILWFGANVLVYRLSYDWLRTLGWNWHWPRGAPGGLTDVLNLPARWADWGLKALLGYLVGGAIVVLVRDARQARKDRAQAGIKRFKQERTMRHG